MKKGCRIRVLDVDIHVNVGQGPARLLLGGPTSESVVEEVQ